MGPAVFWFGLLLCAACGVEIGGFAAGLWTLGDDAGSGVAYTVVFANLAPWTAILGFALLGAARRKVRARAEDVAFGPLPPLVPALARVESSRALSDEGTNIPVRLDLTVAPAERPGYRVDLRVTVNLVDLASYRAGQNLVVAHDPERPWRVELRPNPPREWADSARDAVIASAPPETRVTKPDVLAAAGKTGLRQRVARPGMLAMAVGLVASAGVFSGSFSK